MLVVELLLGKLCTLIFVLFVEKVVPVAIVKELGDKTRPPPEAIVAVPDVPVIVRDPATGKLLLAPLIARVEPPDIVTDVGAKVKLAEVFVIVAVPVPVTVKGPETVKEPIPANVAVDPPVNVIGL